MLTKSYKTEIKADVDKRIVEGYVALFGVPDSDNDVIVKGAFADTIKADFAAPGTGLKNRVRYLYQHLKHEPIGRVTDLFEDSTGLHYRAKLTKGVQRADETLALIKDDVLDEASFGFDTIDSEMGDYSKAEGGESVRVRFLKALKLWEISPVTWGAQAQSTLSEAKAIDSAIEQLKAGRVLSKANLDAIMGAIETHETALDSLRAVVQGALDTVDDDADGDEPESEDDDKSQGAEYYSKAASILESLLRG